MEKGKFTEPKRFLLFLLFYCLLNFVLRLLISDSLKNDEAEMILYFQQSLRLVYNSQPPLYNWLQMALFKVFGLNIFSLALLKNSLIFLFYLFLYKSAWQIFKKELPAVLSSVSLLLVYNFSWILHKDLTHSVLLMALCSITLYLFLKMLFTKKYVYYLLLGVTMGFGMLTKYNYFVLILSLFLAALAIRDYRKAILNKKTLLTLMVFLILILPHLCYCLSNADKVTVDMHKFKQGDGNNIAALKGFSELIQSVLYFLLPLVAVYLLCFIQGFKKLVLTDCSERNIKNFFERFFLFAFLLIVGTILIADVGRIKDRWLWPVLFFIPLYFFVRFKHSKFNRVKVKVFIGIVIFCAAGTVGSVPGRILFASARGKYGRLNYPFSQLAGLIKEGHFKEGLIIAENHVIGGNLKLHFENSFVIIPDRRFSMDPPEGINSLLIAWETEDKADVPQDLRELADKFGFKVGDKKPIAKQVLYKYSRDSYYSLDTVVLDRLEVK